MNLSYKKAQNIKDYKYISSLFNPHNSLYLNKKKATVGEIKKSLKNRTHFIILNEEKIGWFCVGIDQEKGKFGLIIDHKFQGRGNGLRAMDFIEKELVKIGCKQVEMEVMKDNKVAISVYKKAGYVVADKMLIMKKEL